MQFALKTVKKYIKPQPCKEVYEALRKERPGRAQFESMRDFLDRLKDHLKRWESSSCEKCRPIFYQYEDDIKIEFKRMDRLING